MRDTNRNIKKNVNSRNDSGKATIFISIILLVLVILGIASYIFTPTFFAATYDMSPEEFRENFMNVTKKAISSKPEIKHVRTPENVKAIYMTACVAGTTNFRNELVQLIEDTEINSIVIDIKDFSGTISLPSSNPKLIGVNGDGCKAPDMKEFVAELHEKGIYVIGRVTVFQDPYYTKAHPELAVKKASDGTVWKDHKGISFIEVGAKPYWDYVIELANESYDMGFDEINFDYIRFPSDGNMQDIYYPFSNEVMVANPEDGKVLALENFFVYLDQKTRQEKYESPNFKHVNSDRMVTSADLFGMTTTNYDDLNIGQVLEYTLPYFDYVAPMVYPSHYPKTFNGYANPNDYPYELIYFVMKKGYDRAEYLETSTTTPSLVREKVNPLQLRPWLQDFDYGGDYDAADVRAQIQATYDSGLTSWMLWAPSNRYTRAALHDAQ